MPTAVEIIAAPLTLWVAPVDTAFPKITDAPGSPWFKVGTSGNLNYDGAGITVEHGGSVTYFRPVGSSQPRKAFVDEDALTVKLTLADLTLEQYALAMNFRDVEIDEDGNKVMNLLRGLLLVERALLARGPISAYVADELGLNGVGQYEIPSVVQASMPVPVQFKRAEPAMLPLEFRSMAHDSLEPVLRVTAEENT
jgi:hypothetical protein